MKLINLTPHRIDVYSNGFLRVIEPSGKPARIANKRNGEIKMLSYECDNFKFPLIDLESESGSNLIEELPPFQSGTLLIVSQLVAVACKERDDLIFPTDFIRNESGQIIGCESFSRFSVE